MILEEVLDEINSCLKEVLNKINSSGAEIDYDITEPPIPEFGDFSTNICFQLSKILRKPPIQIAQDIVERELQLCTSWNNGTYINGANIKKPGFINFNLNKNVLLEKFLEIEENKDAIFTPRSNYQNNDNTIFIEHTSVNPNKALHVGHLRNAIIGDCLYRIFKNTGKQVKVLNYIDDSGLQVADIIVGFEYGGLSITQDNLASKGSLKFDQYCGNEVYVKINEMYSSRPDLLEKRALVLRELEDPKSSTSIFTNNIVKRVLSDQLKTTWSFKIRYDILNFESQIVQSSLWSQLFEALKDKKIIRYETVGKNTGCWVYSSSSEGDKVLVRSDSTLTYFAKDIPYAAWKLGYLKNPFRFDFFATQWDSTELYSTTLDRTNDNEDDAKGSNHRSRYNTLSIDFDKISKVITIIDSRQERLQNLLTEILTKLGLSPSKYNYLGYEPVILSKETLSIMGIKAANDKAVHMSGRKGIFIEADLALKILQEKSVSETRKRNPHLSEIELHYISREMAISAIRYYFIKYDFGKVITFDVNESLSLEGDTAPYIQYAYARAKKIKDKLSEMQRLADYKPLVKDFKISSLSMTEMDLVKHLCSYTIDLYQSSEKANPKIMAKYLFKLATLFNNFYERSPILRESDSNLVKLRIVILTACLTVFEHSMELIGITPLERM